MLLTFGEMLSSLCVDLKYGTAPTSDVTTRLKRLINEGHRAICRTRRLSEERALELQFNSVSGQLYHGIPQAFDGIRDIIQIDSAVPLKMRTREWFVLNDPQNTSIGTPYVWSPNGMQATSRRPAVMGSGLWAVSTSAADTTQQVRVMCVRAGGGLVVEQTATLTGTTPVRIGALVDIAGVVQFTLSAVCAGSVSLIDAPDLPFTVTLPPFPGGGSTAAPFPSQPVIDNFNRANESPLSGAGSWYAAPAFWTNDPLAIVSNRAVKSNPANFIAASHLNTRFSASDGEAYVTVATVPGMPVTQYSYIGIGFTEERPVLGATFLGYWLAIIRYPVTGAFHLALMVLEPGPGPGTLAFAQPLVDVDTPFANGDAFGIERSGTTVRIHVRNAGAWRVVAELPEAARPVPLYPTLVISDETSAAAIDDFGGGPYHSHLLATIDGNSGQTAQPYYSIRLWPTPSDALPYTVRGTLRIPDMVRDQDHPVFMQPEFSDAVMTYCRMREYKSVKADSERFAMEQAEWEGVIAGLNAASNFAKDYRPVAGRGDRSGWSNLGGWYPADGMSWI